jgi:hypothetical protein
VTRNKPPTLLQIHAAHRLHPGGNRYLVRQAIQVTLSCVEEQASQLPPGAVLTCDALEVLERCQSLLNGAYSFRCEEVKHESDTPNETPKGPSQEAPGTGETP